MKKPKTDNFHADVKFPEETADKYAVTGVVTAKGFAGK